MPDKLKLIKMCIFLHEYTAGIYRCKEGNDNCTLAKAQECKQAEIITKLLVAKAAEEKEAGVSEIFA